MSRIRRSCFIKTLFSAKSIKENMINVILRMIYWET